MTTPGGEEMIGRMRKTTAASWSADERRATAPYQDNHGFSRIVDSWASLYRSVSDGSRQR